MLVSRCRMVARAPGWTMRRSSMLKLVVVGRWLAAMLALCPVLTTGKLSSELLWTNA